MLFVGNFLVLLLNDNHRPFCILPLLLGTLVLTLLLTLFCSVGNSPQTAFVQYASPVSKPVEARLPVTTVATTAMAKNWEETGFPLALTIPVFGTLLIA